MPTYVALQASLPGVISCHKIKMRNHLRNLKWLNVALPILFWTTAVTGQTDSLSLMQNLDKADLMLEKDFPKAKALISELNDQVSLTSCRVCLTRSVILLGKAYWLNGEYDKSVELLKQGMKLAEETKNFGQLAKTANLIGNDFYYQGYYDSAIFYYQHAYSVYKNLDDKAGVARVLGTISLMYHRKGDYPKTVEYLLKGEEVNDESLDEKRLIGDFPGMENIFPDSLYFQEEIQDNLQSLETQLKNGDQIGAYRTYLNLGLAHTQVKEYVKAAQYYLKSFAIQENLGLLPSWEYAALNYSDANMKDSCFYYHEKARQGFSRNTQLNILHAYESMGDAHFHFEQYDSAIRNYSLALKINIKCNNRITIAGLHRRMADVYLRMRKLNEAEEHIQKGIILAKQVSITHQRNLFKSAVSLYSLKGDYKKALYFQGRYTNLLDSLSKIETAINLTRLLVQHKTSKKERELEGLKIEKEKNDLVLKNRNITMISLGGITLVSLAFIIVFAKQRDRIKKKNLALDQANRDQEALIREIHHRVKNNLQIISSLINLKAVKASHETSEVLYQLNGRIYSMGLIHERLYQKNEFQLIALDTYLIELGRYILDSFDETDNAVELKTACETIQIDVDTALTCGLIMNELLTNSMKYAFPVEQEHREVKVELVRNSNGLILIISDNGKNSQALTQSISKNFGLRFVDQLVKSKLNGDWSIEIKNGFCVLIKFPGPNTTHE